MSMSIGGPGGSGNQDFDLNLAPIIDCMTVLITFMLASASFLSIGILDAGVAAAGATAVTDQAPPPVNVAVEIGKDQNFVVHVTGKETLNIPIARGNGQATAQNSAASPYDYDNLTRQLASIAGRYTAVKAVTLSADNSVEYQDIVKAMDVVRKTMPVVLLGGF
jgi:biopolymer transport protein ExbD